MISSPGLSLLVGLLRDIESVRVAVIARRTGDIGARAFSKSSASSASDAARLRLELIAPLVLST
jgi:hypothetical protein